MSKTHVVVLGFLQQQPMHGYRLMHELKTQHLEIWAGIKLPSIYKALQSLEKALYIRGEQSSEGNNPPRMVYSVTETGVTYFHQLLREYLAKSGHADIDFWLAISFIDNSFPVTEVIQAIESRLERLEQSLNPLHDMIDESDCSTKQISFTGSYLCNMALKFHKIEIETLHDLKTEFVKRQ